MLNTNFSLKTHALLGFFTLFIAVFNVQAAEQKNAAAPLKPQDFAYGMALSFDGQDAVYQAALPLPVYQGTTRSDLGDLRVFNAQAEVVPHMLRQPDLSSTTLPVLTKLNFFPLQGTAGTGLDQLSVRIKRNASGTLLDIASTGKSAQQTSLSGYVLDTSGLKPALQALQLNWTGAGENFVGSLHIEASDDLKNWHTIVRDAPLASLQFGGHSLLQNRIEFPPSKTKYLRLSWPAAQTPLRLNNIEAELSGTVTETPLSWLTVQGDSIAEKEGEYQFDLGAHLPVQRIQIELPQLNTLVQAAIFSRANEKDNWRPVSNSLLYKLHHSGQDLNNPDIYTASNTNRYWLLRVDQKSGGLGSGIPAFKVGWHPHQLIFVTRGAAPFQIAYGSSAIKPAGFQIDNMLPQDKDKAALTISTALTSAQFSLGGDTRLSPAAPPHPWKKWILWAVLGVCVALLGWMAYRLVKQMENHDASKI